MGVCGCADRIAEGKAAGRTGIYRLERSVVGRARGVAVRALPVPAVKPVDKEGEEGWEGSVRGRHLNAVLGSLIRSRAVVARLAAAVVQDAADDGAVAADCEGARGGVTRGRG